MRLANRKINLKQLELFHHQYLLKKSKIKIFDEPRCYSTKNSSFSKTNQNVTKFFRRFNVNFHKPIYPIST